MPETSRERVRKALTHQQPERVPIDFGGHRSSGIMAIAYHRLRAYLGLEPRPPRVYDIIQQLAIVDDDVLDRFRVDVVELGRGFAREDHWWQEWRLPDGTDCLVPSWCDLRLEGEHWYLCANDVPVGVQKAGSLYFEQLRYPYADGIPDLMTEIDEAIAEVMWCVPSPPGPAAQGAALKAGAAAFRAETDRAIVGLFGGNLLEFGQFLCRNDNFLAALAEDPDRVQYLLDLLVERHLDALDRFLEDVGESIDVVLFGDDLGMQQGPQISPATYREFFRSRHRFLWNYAKDNADVKVMLHSCGGIRQLLDDLIEAGLDAVNPVQITCAGMDAAELKRDFGDRLTFWGGGCDTRHVLPRATPAEVREHVLRQCDILAPGGGFVFQQVHNIMADVPPENIVAMFDAVNEFNGG